MSMQHLNNIFCTGVWLVAASILWTQPSSRAASFASGVTNNGSQYSFILNENADNVTLLFNNGATTNSLGALTKGLYSFDIGSSTNYQIVVTKAAPPGYAMVSGTTNAFVQIISPTNGSSAAPLGFPAGRGVAINKNPRSPYFGRVYVANATAGTVTSNGVSRTVGDGIYMLNADLSDAVGQGDTAMTGGLDSYFATGAGGNASPFRIAVGKDDNRLYICDWSDPAGNLYVTDPNVSAGSGSLALKALSGTATTPIGTANNHGSVTAVIVEGSTEAGNLKIWTIDEDMQADRASTTLNQMNSLWRYDVNAALLPFENDATRLWSSSTSNKDGYPAASQMMDMDRGADGKFYIVTKRDNGLESGLIVRSASGGSTLFNSYVMSTNAGASSDLLRGAITVAVSPNQKFVAVLRYDLRAWILPLTNGIPDLSRRLWLAGFPTLSSTRASARFDAAGNLYVINNTNQQMRILAPGGTTIATTSGDLTGTNGAFTIITADPAIATQTANITTNAGFNVTLAVTATGTTPISYQWLFYGTNVPNATNASLARNNAQQAVAGPYFVIISNAMGMITSATVNLTIQASAPVITAATTNKTVAAGSNMTFSVTAPGSDPRFYQWYFNGSPILNATNASYGKPNAQPSDSGDYSVIVTNGLGWATTNASLTVTNTPAVIIGQSKGATNGAGANITFYIIPQGNEPRSCQWYTNGVAVPGATATNFVILNAQAYHAANYSATVTNDLGSATSSTMTLLITNRLAAISKQPSSQTNGAGANITLSITAAGTQPLLYQWYRNGNLIPDATATNLVLTNVQVDIDDGTYSVTLTNELGLVISADAVLTITNRLPYIATQPASQTVNEGTNVTFTVVAMGTSPLSYQWYLNGTTLLTDQTNATLTLANVQTSQAGTYYVEVSNPLGSTTSSNAVLTVNPSVVADPPAISNPTGAGSANITLTWSAVSGRTYQVQYKDDLSASSWTALTPNVIASGATASTTDSPASLTNRFYRVILLP